MFVNFLDTELFREYIGKGYQSVAAVNNGLDFPSIMTDFERKFKSAFYEKVCIEKIKNQFGSTCGLDIADKGLETVAIFILESSRKLMIELDASEDKEETGKRIIQSKEMTDLGKPYKMKKSRINFFHLFEQFFTFLENLVHLVNTLFGVLFQEFEQSLSRVLSIFHLRKNIVLVFMDSFAFTVMYLTFS